MEENQDLKGGKIEMEDLNKCNSIEEEQKEDEMGKKKSSTKSPKKTKKPKIKVSGSYKRRRK